MSAAPLNDTDSPMPVPGKKNGESCTHHDQSEQVRNELFRKIQYSAQVIKGSGCLQNSYSCDKYTTEVYEYQICHTDSGAFSPNISATIV